jgi:hypothetical protein
MGWSQNPVNTVQKLFLVDELSTGSVDNEVFAKRRTLGSVEKLTTAPVGRLPVSLIGPVGLPGVTEVGAVTVVTELSMPGDVGTTSIPERKPIGAPSLIPVRRDLYTCWSHKTNRSPLLHKSRHWHAIRTCDSDGDLAQGVEGLGHRALGRVAHVNCRGALQLRRRQRGHRDGALGGAAQANPTIVHKSRNTRTDEQREAWLFLATSLADVWRDASLRVYSG